MHLELCRRFYDEVVHPLLDVPHSAALMGRGSEVLGFDDEMSADHNCEARVVLFVADPDLVRLETPDEFEGRPALVEVHTLRGYFLEQLNFDLGREITARDWLTFSEQNLCMVTAGAVFHDEVGLKAARERFAYYPRDVWFYLLTAGWWRIHPEVNLVGRSGFVGDELGSAVIGARLVQDLMRLCFLMERQYAPYAKWFGTAFSRLSCGPSLLPILQTVLRAESWQEREKALMAAYEEVARIHNALQITPTVEIGVEQLWGRPFKVVWGDFIGALGARIQDPAVKEIADRWPAGGVDQLREILWFAKARPQLLAVLDPAG